MGYLGWKDIAQRATRHPRLESTRLCEAWWKSSLKLHNASWLPTTITYDICLSVSCWLSQAVKSQFLWRWITGDFGSHSYIVCCHMAARFKCSELKGNTVSLGDHRIDFKQAISTLMHTLPLYTNIFLVYLCSFFNEIQGKTQLTRHVQKDGRLHSLMV